MLLLTDVPVAVGSVLALTLSSLLWKLNSHRQRFRSLPKPPHSYLFGHLILFTKIFRSFPGHPPLALVLSIIQSQYKLPDVYYLDLWPLIPEPFLVTGDLAVSSRFLDEYTRHPSVLGTALQKLTAGSRGLVSSEVSEWYGSRTAIRTAFSVTNVQRFVPEMAQYSMELRAELLRRATKGHRFPLIEPIEKWGADLTFRFLLGDDAAVQRGGWGAQINDDIQAVIAQIDAPMSWTPWTYLRRKREQAQRQERVRNKIRDTMIEALRKERPASQNQFVPLLDSLAAKYAEEFPDRKSWDSDTLIQHLDTLMTMFLAADVSSMVLTYVFYHISQSPEVAVELRKEHNAVFPGDVQTALETLRQNPGKFKDLPYTTAVIKESMRLRPPGVSPTIAPKGHTLNYEGVEHSLEGNMLQPNIFRLQSNESYISHPTTFDPTRWLPTPSSSLADSWRPFQRGRHSCMGENMMMPGLVIALLLIIRDVDVALAYDETDVNLGLELGGLAYMDGSFAAKPAKGLPVTVKELRR